MPVLPAPLLRPPYWQVGGHLQTVAPNLLRKVSAPYRRERLELPDGDFLDLDWLAPEQEERATVKRLVILSHGLEGNARRPYCTGLARHFAEAGWAVCAWNCRSCSGELNRLPRFYHHGDTPDLAAVEAHCLRRYPAATIAHVGYSMGGNLIVKHFGEQGGDLHPRVGGGVAISTPFDLTACAYKLERRSMRIYSLRFIKSLRPKIEAKSRSFPQTISFAPFAEGRIKRLHEFTETYTAPLHGFANADDFYARCSSGPYLDGVKRPLLALNSRNDPFLAGDCWPEERFKANPDTFLEAPRHGGHVGFEERGQRDTYAERRALRFAEQCVA